MNNRNACRFWADRLEDAWAETEPKRRRLREMAQRDPTDDECDDLIEWASAAAKAMSPEAEE
jgi:hypothetical protein